jgi:hypothetical protein
MVMGTDMLVISPGLNIDCPQSIRCLKIKQKGEMDGGRKEYASETRNLSNENLW